MGHRIPELWCHAEKYQLLSLIFDYWEYFVFEIRIDGLSFRLYPGEVACICFDWFFNGRASGYLRVFCSDDGGGTWNHGQRPFLAEICSDCRSYIDESHEVGIMTSTHCKEDRSHYRKCGRM